MSVICKNCNHTFKGNFCNNCGQTAHTHEINFHSILHEIQHSIFHIDKGILYTTKELLKSPGQTIRDYLYGKRVKHFKPVAYIFVLSTIYAIVSKISHKSTFLDSFLEGFYNGATDDNSKNSLGFLGDVVKWLSSHYAYTTLFIIPIISFASYLCFYRAKYNYFQHLILNCFVAGQRTAIFLILLPFTYFITNEDINNTIDTLKAYTSVGLTFWSYYHFFNTTKPWKRILLTLLTYVVLGVLLLLIIIIMGIASKFLKF